MLWRQIIAERSQISEKEEILRRKRMISSATNRIARLPLSSPIVFTMKKGTDTRLARGARYYILIIKKTAKSDRETSPITPKNLLFFGGPVQKGQARTPCTQLPFEKTVSKAYCRYAVAKDARSLQGAYRLHRGLPRGKINREECRDDGDKDGYAEDQRDIDGSEVQEFHGDDLQHRLIEEVADD